MLMVSEFIFYLTEKCIFSKSFSYTAALGKLASRKICRSYMQKIRLSILRFNHEYLSIFGTMK